MAIFKMVFVVKVINNVCAQFKVGGMNIAWFTASPPTSMCMSHVCRLHVREPGTEAKAICEMRL